MEYLFKIRGKEVSTVNRKQAEVPDNCAAIPNKAGTAPGMWFEKSGKVFVSMPGVPFEMKSMMEHEIIPRLKKQFKTPFIFHKTILTQGVGESVIAEMIEKWEDNLPKHIKLAYLPSPGMVRLRLTANGDDEKIKTEVEDQWQKVKPVIENYVYGYDNDTLQEIVGKLLRKKNKLAKE